MRESECFRLLGRRDRHYEEVDAARVFGNEPPIGEQLAKVAHAAESLGVGHPGRVFHLMLLDKSERVSVEELRQNLSIVDEGSLVLLPLENTDKVGVLLRELFGRILP